MRKKWSLCIVRYRKFVSLCIILPVFAATNFSCHELGVGYQFQQQLRKLSHFHLSEGSHNHHGSSHGTTPRPRLSLKARPQGVNAPLKTPLLPARRLPQEADLLCLS